MEQVWQIFDGPSRIGDAFTPDAVLLSLLLAFVLGQVLAWVYYFTHSGLSYSRTFVQSLIIITIIVALIMGIIGNNIITAFGLMGALAIIRFRNILKDTRDTVFIFCALIIGMATGTMNYSLAIIGTVFICLVVIYMYFTSFGARRPHNSFLRFRLSEHIGPDHPVVSILKRFCRSFVLISAQDIGDGAAGIEYAYQLMIKDVSKNERMLEEFEKIKGIESINLTIQEQLLEV